MLFGLYNVQVFDMIDDEPVSPFVRLNPDLSVHFLGSGGGEDYTVDVNAESRETGVFEEVPPSVEEAFRRSMVLVVTGTRGLQASARTRYLWSIRLRFQSLAIFRSCKFRTSYCMRSSELWASQRRGQSLIFNFDRGCPVHGILHGELRGCLLEF
jgi:hypothetical protein